jgi:hypothetical protein
MAAVTSAFLVAGGSNSYLAAEYLSRRIGEEAAQAVNIAPTVWREDLMGDSTLTAHFRFLDQLGNATSQSEGTTLTQVSWSPEGVTIAAGLDGFYVLESNLVQSISPEVLDKIAEQGGTALGRTIDSALAALFASLTAGTIGTTGTALVFDNITTGIAKLDANFAIGQKYGRLHPQAFGDLITSISGKNYGVSKLSVDANNQEVLDIQGVEIRKNALVPKINTNADYSGGIYCEQALGLAVAQNPMVEILSVPMQASKAIECTVAFGVGVVRPKFGVAVVSGINA